MSHLMALKLFPIPFPIIAPSPNPDNHRLPTHLRFSRWNNANSHRFNHNQQDIEDELRRTRRFNSASNILHNYDPPTSHSPSFKSKGTPSSPSSPSIPGKKSKYSKPDTHPAFRKINKPPSTSRASTKLSPDHSKNATIKLSNDGLSYVIEGAPFEFKYSYTETPKAKPLKLREEPYAPFGPETMPRPWTGRAPSQPSKKAVREFDSFKLPPPNKKGVKPVQAPGPYLPGTGPRYVRTREEVLGEDLTKKEVKELIDSCLKSKRQLNIGRDGLTHNMLDNIHAHWKRRRVCKIKCKGVCTVDMDNVCQQLEEKTGGKVIFRKGGVLYLFRGRNYNYRFRPYFPLMLWKPITPVYPRLIQKAPEGLTVDEAAEMRKKGRRLIPICKLAKNGVYCDLVKQVKEAFEECELVRINCQGLNGNDYRKIGAKLRDLVPCVLISFEHEHILMWRGRDWKSSFTEEDGEDSEASKIVATSSHESHLELQEPNNFQAKDESLNALNMSTSYSSSEEQEDTVSATEIDEWYSAMDARPTTVKVQNTETTLGSCSYSDTEFEATSDTFDNEEISDGVSSSYNDNESDAKSNNEDDEATLDRISSSSTDHEFKAISRQTDEAMLYNIDSAYADDKSGVQGVVHSREPLVDNTSSCSNDNDSENETDMDNAKFRFEITIVLENLQDANNQTKLHMPYMEGVRQLWKEALDGGSAVVLAETDRDADTVYQRSVALAQSAPPGPVFTRRRRKIAVQENDKRESVDLEIKEVATNKISKKEESDRNSVKPRRKDINDEYVDAVPQGRLKIDELAKLLA